MSSSVASPGRGRICPMQRLRPWTASGRRVPYRSRLPRGNHRQITFLCLGTFVPGILGVTAVVESGKAVKATFWARLIPESAARRASLGDRGFDPHSLQSPRAEWVPFGGTRRLSRRQTNEQASKPKPISRATEISNPVPSSGESTSRAILPSHGEKPAFRAGVRARQVQRGQQRRVSRGAWRRQAGISLSDQIPVPRRR